MAKGELNRNLLFGLLAFQNGFIDQSALVSAFQGWMRDKGQSLADFLIDRGDLKKGHKSAIEAIIALHEENDGQSLERGIIATGGWPSRSAGPTRRRAGQGRRYAPRQEMALDHRPSAPSARGAT